jgi:subtilisin family serine protease/subtilisin-like proprotein convertase family protein
MDGRSRASSTAMDFGKDSEAAVCYHARHMLFRVLFVVALVACSFNAGRCAAQVSDSSSTGEFHFLEPRPTGYRVENAGAAPGLRMAASAGWVRAWPLSGSTNFVEFNSRVVVRLNPGEALDAVLQGRSLRLARSLGEGLFILQAADAHTAVREADRLARDGRVILCYPVTRRPKQLLGSYAPRPDDPFFYRANTSNDQYQSHLENRDANGTPLGIDLNVRAAWPFSRGEGVILAIADDGIELDHPDLRERTQGAPHFDFRQMTTNGAPSGGAALHATPVAGLAAATAGNGIGVAGVAPGATLASWVIFGPSNDVVSDEALMDMLQYQSNVVSIQNHSWGKVGREQVPVSPLEDMAISNAVYSGRSGKGVVIVRAGGNARPDGNDANEDGYLADPRVIAVAAARLDGKVAGYGAPGACLLVAAPGGDSDSSNHPCLPNSPRLVTTDRQGPLGFNHNFATDDSADYTFGTIGFTGTSASCPLVAGVAALVLAANTNLTYRDVQQVLVLASRYTDYSDPTLVTNGAGFRVSHNLGFGVPDAGAAVQLARAWSNRPPATTVTYSQTNSAAIPDLGLRAGIDGTDVPENLRSIVALPGLGPQFDSTTALLPLVDVGSALSSISTDLRGKAALIQRGGSDFCQKIFFAAQAGAVFALIYNNVDLTVRKSLVGTDLTPIPSVSLSQRDGEALRDYLKATPGVRAQLTFDATNYRFKVSETLQCEFVGVRLDTDHTARGDLRVVLTSPAGTRSVLQRVNDDSLPGPTGWTYYSVQHFHESSFGTWTLTVSDQNTRGRGSIKSASLIILGVAIRDTDHDGLDDDWELRYFHSLEDGPGDDPDHDGYSNAREQIMQTDPSSPNPALTIDLSVWDEKLARISWPASSNSLYQVEAASEPGAPATLLTNVPGRFAETEWFTPYTNALHQFFKVQALPITQP